MQLWLAGARVRAERSGSAVFLLFSLGFSLLMVSCVVVLCDDGAFVAGSVRGDEGTLFSNVLFFLTLIAHAARYRRHQHCQRRQQQLCDAALVYTTRASYPYSLKSQLGPVGEQLAYPRCPRQPRGARTAAAAGRPRCYPRLRPRPRRQVSRRRHRKPQFRQRLRHPKRRRLVVGHRRAAGVSMWFFLQ